MRVLARDYLAFHRKEVLYTLMWAYVGTIALAAGYYCGSGRRKNDPAEETHFVILIIVFPIVLACLSHLVAIWLWGSVLRVLPVFLCATM